MKYYFYFTLIFLLVSLSSSQVELPKEVIAGLSSRAVRIHHYLWHTVRNNWELLDENSRNEIIALGWEPANSAQDKDGKTMSDNLSGEDFLYMHRVMINRINEQLNQCEFAYGKIIVGWIDIPAPNDTEHPVPPIYDSGSDIFNEKIVRYKSVEFYNEDLKLQNDKYKNPEVLRNLTLAQLGAFIEFEVHNQMHVRFSAESKIGYRPEPVPIWETVDIDTKWDDPVYEWMGDFYSSQVASVFYKLHGWVDDRIEDWKVANRIVGEIKWNGTWLGPMVNHTMFSCNETNTDDKKLEYDNTRNSNNEEVLRILESKNIRGKFMSK